MSNKRDTSEPQNPDKKHRALNKAKKKLEARQNAYTPKSAGGHDCHRPGSLKVR